MGIAKVLIAIFLISAVISADAGLIPGLEDVDQKPNPGSGSVKVVRRFKRSTGDDLYTKCNAAGSKMVCLGAKVGDRVAESTCVTEKDCTYMVAVHKDTTNYEFQLINFEAITNPKNYVSVGIASEKSEDAGKGMKDTIIIACHDTIPGDNPNYQVLWAQDADRPYPVSPGERDAILVKGSPSPVAPASSGGQLYCKFQTKPSFSIEGHNFDLDKNFHKILLAIGPVNENAKDKELVEHSAKSLTAKISLNKSGGDGKTSGSDSTRMFSSFTMITLGYAITKFFN